MSTNDFYNHVRGAAQRETDYSLELISQVCHFLKQPDMVEAAQEHFVYKDLVKKCLKPKKDENAPKKPLSSYMLFCQDIREEVTKKNPTLKMHELSKKLAERWSKAKDEVKEEFQKKAEEQKEAYAKAMEEYKKELHAQKGSMSGVGSANASVA